jgi:hypothetical protein
MAVDFDKILQSLVVTMEHPDPFVRKVAMYWMSRIVQAHISSAFTKRDEIMGVESVKESRGIDTSISDGEKPSNTHLTAASISVRNSLPHVLPGILLRYVSLLFRHMMHLLSTQASHVNHVVVNSASATRTKLAPKMRSCLITQLIH